MSELPTPALIAIGVVLFLFTFASLAFLVTVYFERRDARLNPVQGWDESPTSELTMWVEQDRREKETCPHCRGRRCYDFRVNGRPCGENPTEAVEGKKATLIGRHFKHTVIPVPAGWWPLPKTHMARTRQDLWAKAALHCQIALGHGRAVGLP